MTFPVVNFARAGARAIIALLIVPMIAAVPLAAQTVSASTAPSPPRAGRALTLADALKLAESGSEALQIARAGVDRAHGQQIQARSQYLPQLNGTAQYTRTLKSQFSVFQNASPEPPPGTPPVPPTDPNVTYYQPCTRYLASAGATQAEQVAGLNQYALCSSGGNGGIDFSRAGFGAANQYNLGVSGSINVFTGGRVQAQNAAAVAGRRSADIELSAQRAQLTLDVAQAYYDALLADRLVGIADSTLVQTERAYRQTSVAREVGNTSEFEQLRAQVQRDNQRPVVIQARTNRDIAYLRLKQLLNLPYEQSLALADDLGDGEAEVRQVAALGAVGASVTPEDTTAEERATVRELAETLRAQQAQARVARAERLPAVQLTTSYGRVAFPASGAPSWNNFLTNWTVSVGASVPLFTGGRIRGEEMVAKANVAETRARLEQTKELAALDAQQTIAQVRQAEAALAASRGTAMQASRAFSIADVRYREGISTQLELAESRTQLQQALANRAIAARDYQVAQLRLALLKDLPLGAGASQQLQMQGQGGTLQNGAAGAAGAAGGSGQQQPPRSASASINPGTGQ